MIRPVISDDDIPIYSFQADGSPIYTDKINGHFILDDVPSMCDADYECRTCLKVYRALCKLFCKPRNPADPKSPWIGLRPIKNKPLPIYDRALQILQAEALLPERP
ncbi:hypothetical protein Ddye_013573 [Dipteronia dyeriana]|uniref:Uncharacterized protein n=1 Tax=Dipteronia dyeriana TaxID=168575 RepID=A0AAD9X6N7_9ROSI|nr:hypothetical protein Ddye_013573 [Dipteronia dyeriana]